MGENTFVENKPLNNISPQTKEAPPMELFKKVVEAVKITEPPWKASPEEPYAIRPLNPNNSDETQAFNDIDRSPQALGNMANVGKSPFDEIDYLINADPTYEHYKNKKGKPEPDPRFISAVVDKDNKAVGWVQYYLEKNIDALKKQGENIPDDALVLEVSYAKLFNKWPKYTRFIRERTNLPDEEAKGVATCGIKQTLIKLKQMEKTFSEASNLSPRKIFVSAYTYPDNIASEKVLENNGFKKLPQQITDDDNLPNNVWIKEV